MHNAETRKKSYNVKAKHAACPVCRGLRYKIPAGTPCSGCARTRDTKFCSECAGLPERVEGTACRECGTAAGKNAEYKHEPRRTSSSGWGMIT